MSIRLRLALQFAAILAVTLVLFSAAVYFFTYKARQESFTGNLFSRARIVAHVYLDGADLADEASRLSYRRYLRQFYRTLPEEEVRVYNGANRVVFREGQLTEVPVPTALLAAVRKTGKQVQIKPELHQTVGMLYRDARRGEFVIVASSVDSDTRTRLLGLRRILLGGLVVSLGIVGIGGWFFAGQALRPMQKVVREVDSITVSDLHRRLSQAHGHDEIAHLAQRFNQLLDRLEVAFAGQRTFVRDASHELRTPLTVLIGELEVALLQKDRSPEEYRRVLQSTLDSARLLNDLTNGLLQIARASDDPSQVSLTVLRLDELLLQAHEEVQRRHPTSRIDLEFGDVPVRVRQPFAVRGNEALLLSAFLNVLENACKFSVGAATPVLASLTTTSKHVVLEVRDYGAGMSEADRQQVFVPFFRAEAMRSVPGHGIGLPLTAKIMALHGGEVRVESQLHEGTQVWLEWPAIG